MKLIIKTFSKMAMSGMTLRMALSTTLLCRMTITRMTLCRMTVSRRIFKRTLTKMTHSRVAAYGKAILSRTAFTRPRQFRMTIAE